MKRPEIFTSKLYPKFFLNSDKKQFFARSKKFPKKPKNFGPKNFCPQNRKKSKFQNFVFFDFAGKFFSDLVFSFFILSGSSGPGKRVFQPGKDVIYKFPSAELKRAYIPWKLHFCSLQFCMRHKMSHIFDTINCHEIGDPEKLTDC